MIRALQLILDIPVQLGAYAILFIEWMVKRINQEHAHGHADHQERQVDPFQLQ